MAQPAIAELDRRFGIPDSASVIEGNGGFAKVAIGTGSAAGALRARGLCHLVATPRRGRGPFRQLGFTRE